jgi:hypothetical protein
MRAASQRRGREASSQSSTRTEDELGVVEREATREAAIKEAEAVELLARVRVPEAHGAVARAGDELLAVELQALDGVRVAHQRSLQLARARVPDLERAVRVARGDTAKAA